MAHEFSATVLNHGRWFVIDTVGEDAGRILGPKKGFDTSQQADSYAQQRSSNTNKRSDRNKGEK